MIALARANSRSPSSPWMRPKPESPTPPNGSAPTPAYDRTELTLAIPDRIRRAIASPPVRAKTAAPSPYEDALARSTASSTSATLVTVSVGPKVSSGTAAASSGTSTSTVGYAYGGRTASAPPTTARPPRASASSCAGGSRRAGPAW